MRIFTIASLMFVAISAFIQSGFCAEKVTVINQGIPGNNSREGKARLQKSVLNLKPEHLIIYFGINDSCNSTKLVPVLEFESNLQLMVDKAKTAGVKNILLLTPNPVNAKYVASRHQKHPQKERLNQHVARYDEAVRKLATENDLQLIDFRKLILENGGASEAKNCLIRNKANSGAADGIHPTPEGYRKLGNLIYQSLKSKVKRGETIVCFGDSITFGAHVKGAGTATGETYPGVLSALLNSLKSSLGKE